MGILDKLGFGKKNDDWEFDKLADKEMGLTPEPNLDFEQKQNLGLNEKSPFDEPAKPAAELPPHLGGPEPTPIVPKQRLGGPPVPPPHREMELINSKLDTIKAMLDSMERRLANLEKAAGVGERPKLW